MVTLGRVSQDGLAIRRLREANGLSRERLSADFDLVGYSVSATSIKRWEGGEPVQHPEYVWAGFQKLREAGKLPRGDLDAVGIALGQIEKGPENHQKPEEAPNLLQQGTSSHTYEPPLPDFSEEYWSDCLRAARRFLGWNQEEFWNCDPKTFLHQLESELRFRPDPVLQAFAASYRRKFTLPAALVEGLKSQMAQLEAKLEKPAQA